jgi:hypothetical protein
MKANNYTKFFVLSMCFFLMHHVGYSQNCPTSVTSKETSFQNQYSIEISFLGGNVKVGEINLYDKSVGGYILNPGKIDPGFFVNQNIVVQSTGQNSFRISSLTKSLNSGDYVVVVKGDDCNRLSFDLK